MRLNLPSSYYPGILLVLGLAFCQFTAVNAAELPSLIRELEEEPRPTGGVPDNNKLFPTARIIGGMDAEPNSWPSTIALARSGTNPLLDRFFCGATVVASNWVMTAAHCLFDVFGNVVRPSSIRVVSGVRNLQTDTPDEEHIVSNIYIHPEYDNTRELPPNDIALLELGSEVDVPAVTLFTGQPEQRSGDFAFIAGWGATRFVDENNATFPAQMQDASVPIVPLSRCNSIVSYQGLVTDRQVCAGFIDGGVDSCAGDSGGPLYVIDDGQIIQMGITSFGNSCALPNFYGIYTSVSHFIPWLRNYIEVPQPIDPLEPPIADPGDDGSGGKKRSWLASVGSEIFWMFGLVILFRRCRLTSTTSY